MPIQEKQSKPQLPADVVKVFTDAAISFPRDFANQAQHIVAAHRPAGLPERFQPKLMVSQWDQFFKDYEQRKKAEEAAKQGGLSPQDKELQKRRLEEKAAEKGRQVCRELEEILRAKRIDQVISRAWGIPNPHIEHNPRFDVNEDGTEWNKSGVFITRRYTYKREEWVAGESHRRSESDPSSGRSSEGYSKVVDATGKDEAGIAFINSDDLWYKLEEEQSKGREGVWTDFLRKRINIRTESDYQHLTSEQKEKLWKEWLNAINQNFQQGLKIYFVYGSGEDGSSSEVPIDHPDAEQIFFQSMMASEERKKERQSRKL